MDTFKDFKAAVDTYLKQEDRSQASFAKKLGYTPDQLNKWLWGVNKIPYKVVREICSILKLDKRQQVRVFALAGYPLPVWVEELLSTPPSPVIDEDGLAFDPSIIGHYAGESQEQHATAEGNKPIPGAENIERFAIERVQGWVRITGRSFDKTTEKRISTWHGRLWKVENGNILSFAIELDTDSRELCTLLITCQNGEAEGWFYSGRDYRRFIYEFWAKKVASV